MDNTHWNDFLLKMMSMNPKMFDVVKPKVIVGIIKMTGKEATSKEFLDKALVWMGEVRKGLGD